MTARLPASADERASAAHRPGADPVAIRWHPAAPAGRAPVVAIGTFDGVHRGHRAILEAALAWARADGRPAVALTFDPPPREVLAPERAPLQLTSLQQRLELLLAAGIDACAVIGFDRQVAALTPEQFVEEVLAGQLGVGGVVAGYNFGFGRGRSGDATTLQALGRRLGIRVQVVGPVAVHGTPVSSSWVRRLVGTGDVRAAAAALGRPFAVRGEVVRGAGRGRALGYPTANVRPGPRQLLPQDGVYFAWARLLPTQDVRPGQRLAALAVVSTRPTFGGGEGRWLEVHCLEAVGDWYGRVCEVEFLERLRAIRAFAGPRDLTAQIEEDRRAAARYFAGRDGSNALSEGSSL